MTPKQVIELWEELPPTQAEAKKTGAKEWRTGATAKRYAKMVNPKYANGGFFKSMGEIYAYENLRKLKRAGKIKDFTYEADTFEYQFKVQHYTPDFRVTRLDDTTFQLEYKGRMDKITQDKLKAIRRCNPDLELKIQFERGKNKIRKGSPTNYIVWAEKLGIGASDNEIKEEWL